MTENDTSPEALAALPPCTLCGDPAGEHELLPRWGALGPCTREGCRCPAWGFAGEIEDE